MKKEDSKSPLRLTRPAGPLPTKADFSGCLDGQWAWKNFGGLVLEEAYALFLTNPLHYQEDFFYMWPKGFGYYFPVIDQYLREVSGDDDDDDCEVAILGAAIAEQFGEGDTLLGISLVEEIADLSRYVSSHLGQYSPEEKIHRSITRAWGKVDQKIATYRLSRSQRKRG